MKITIKNCNNIDHGEFEIEEKCLNIKYAINGTGKTTIAKAIDSFVRADDSKDSLIPFKHIGKGAPDKPELIGYECFKKVAVFNEKYIENYIFQQNDLLKNSFEVFIKTENYDKHSNEIKALLEGINTTFTNHPELDELIDVFQEFVNGFGKSKSGYSKTSAIGKGIGKGNNIENIPEDLVIYEPYLRSGDNVKWIKWQLEGEIFLNRADICPYCTSPVAQKKETILKIGKTYDAKAIEHINNILGVLNKLNPYFSDETNNKINEISKNATGITPDQEIYLAGVKMQVENLLGRLKNLKGLGFYSLRTVDKVADELENYRIKLSYYPHLNSDISQEKVKIINDTLDEVLKKAGELQGEIAQQKNEIKNTIDTYSNEINDFLQSAGYKYRVSIEECGSEYHLMLKHIEGNANIESANDCLSFGERNAFALALFMYGALRENPDLVILDDPISSFDGNKKFAIINMLFFGKRCFRDNTVLLLTHEFNTVIDAVLNMPYNFNPIPKASFLTVKNGILQEKRITKKDIKSFKEIALTNMRSNMDSLNKLIYLRRFLEIDDKEGLPWQLLSNIFHKRENPEYHSPDGDRLMTEEEISNASIKICEYIEDFNYDIEFQKTQDVETLKEIYSKSKSNYEKLQIYRILCNENSSNKVIRKFVNEAFHPENDYLFQLNPCEYDTVPQYIIDECDRDLLKVSGA